LTELCIDFKHKLLTIIDYQHFVFVAVHCTVANLTFDLACVVLCLGCLRVFGKGKCHYKSSTMNRGRRRPYEDHEGGERYFKRRRTSSHTEKKEEDLIKNEILTAGEKTGSVISIETVAKSLETLLFTQDLDRNILEIFHQFQALRA